MQSERRSGHCSARTPVAILEGLLKDDTMSIERRMEILANCAMFQGLPPEALADLAAHASERKFAQGQILFTANSPADGFYIVLSGSIRAFRVNLDGREQTIHVEHAGGTLAEVAVFDGGCYPSTAMAEENSQALFLGKQYVHHFLLQYPEAALSILSYMAKKLRTVASLAEHLALKDVSQRLATLLLEEAQRNIPDLTDGASFSMPLSHTQLASRLGSVREVVTRGLQKLVHLGIIEMHGHRIIVLNVKALHAEAQTHSNLRGLKP